MLEDIAEIGLNQLVRLMSIQIKSPKRRRVLSRQQKEVKQMRMLTVCAQMYLSIVCVCVYGWTCIFVIHIIFSIHTVMHNGFQSI